MGSTYKPWINTRYFIFAVHHYNMHGGNRYISFEFKFGNFKELP